MATETNPLVAEAQARAAEGAAAEAQGVMDRTVILSLQLGSLGTRKRVRQDDVKVRPAEATLLEGSDPEQEFLHVSKDIIQSDELGSVRKQQHAIRAYVRANSVPSFLKGGMYLVRVDAIEAIDDELQRLRVTLTGLVERFIEAYPGLCEQAREKLGSMYRPEDYPTIDQVRAAFTWDLRLLTFTTPSRLRSISKALFDRERDNLARSIQTAADEIRTLLRSQARDLLDHMVERLTPDADGKAKTFKKGTVDNVVEFLRSFDARNVVDDTELSGIVTQIRGMLEGVDAASLRKQEGLREAVRSRAREIKGRLDGMVVERPRRDVSWSDE